MMEAIHKGHGLKAEALHCHLWSQQEPMIKVIKELVPAGN